MSGPKLKRLLDGATGKIFPAWSAVVSRGNEIVFRGAGGISPASPGATNGHARGTEVTESSHFDLASLTKALVTASCAMHFVANGELPLDEPAADLLGRPIAGGPAITPRRLLSHASGLPAWRALFLEVPEGPDRRGEILRAACGTRPIAPAGTAALYSDLNFLILTSLLEKVGGERLDRLFERLLAPKELLFRPIAEVVADRRTSAYVATEIDPTRGLLAGQVNDENAWAMGGVSGHAGLFGTAEGVRSLSQTLVDVFHGRSSFASQQACHLFWTPTKEPKGSTWALGWDTPSAKGSTAGPKPPAGAVGHLGFTGNSLWIDPAREVIGVLLTNGIWPDRSNQTIRAFRPRFHEAVWEATRA